MSRHLLVLALCTLAAAGPSAAAEEVLTVLHGQYYHRTGHLKVDHVIGMPMAQAVTEGYEACPECTPPRLHLGKKTDDGPSPYFKELERAQRRGVLYKSLGARRGGVGSDVTEAPGAPEAAAAPKDPFPFQTIKPSSDLPGTAGLLKAATFDQPGQDLSQGYIVLTPNASPK